MSLLIKICGFSEPVALEAALDAGADMVGFVVFERSPRHVGLGRARALAPRVEGRARIVALTVDADDAALAAIVEALAPDVLQLHGAETPDRVAAIKTRFGLPVMKAIGIADRTDLDRISAYDGVADSLLFDARPPAGATLPGGNGEAFDWSLLHGVATRKPWLLAGGLTPDTVDLAIRATGAPGVDVSSGVETRPGVKDAKLIAQFVTQARSASLSIKSFYNARE